MQQYDKMILAILQGDDYHDAVHSLNEHGFYATVLNSSGGFLKKRSVTLMIGLESARLDEALAILKKHGERTEMRYEAPVLSPNMPPIPLSTAPLEIPTRCGGPPTPTARGYRRKAPAPARSPGPWRPNRRRSATA